MSWWIPQRRFPKHIYNSMHEKHFNALKKSWIPIPPSWYHHCSPHHNWGTTETTLYLYSIILKTCILSEHILMEGLGDDRCRLATNKQHCYMRKNNGCTETLHELSVIYVSRQECLHKTWCASAVASGNHLCKQPQLAIQTGQNL